MKAASILPILLILSCHGPPFLASSSLVVTGFAYSPPPFAKSASIVNDECCRCCHQKPMIPRWRCQQQAYRRDAIARAMARDTTGHAPVDGVPSVAASDATSKSGQSEYIWDVYVSSQTSKKNKEKGIIPTSSLIQAFIFLDPSSGDVRVAPAVFHKQNKQKGKGHLVRCVQRKRGNNNDGDGEIVSALEIGNVDTVDKVYRIMTEHMKLGEINPKACECMRCYFEGNQSLQEGEASQAIALYDQALSAAKGYSSQLPKGSILMKRARAYLKRAAKHRAILRMHVKDLTDTVPSASTMKVLYQTALAQPALSTSIFQRLAGDTKVQQAKFREIRYRHDMYEFALLHAVQDSLQATQILPQNANAWLLAGQCLAELRKLKESNQYYQRALEIDPSMEDALKGAMDRNRSSQEFMEVARASGFSGDTLRLALDVAA